MHSGELSVSSGDGESLSAEEFGKRLTSGDEADEWPSRSSEADAPVSIDQAAQVIAGAEWDDGWRDRCRLSSGRQPELNELTTKYQVAHRPGCGAVSSEVGDALTIGHARRDVEQRCERVQDVVVSVGQLDRETTPLTGPGVEAPVSLREAEEVGVLRAQKFDVRHAKNVSATSDKNARDGSRLRLSNFPRATPAQPCESPDSAIHESARMTRIRW
nr:hypothetical protein [Candidatus Blastococcus massiliensis]